MTVSFEFVISNKITSV